jgi:hypothetical protein
MHSAAGCLEPVERVLAPVPKRSAACGRAYSPEPQGQPDTQTISRNILRHHAGMIAKIILDKIYQDIKKQLIQLFGTMAAF